MTIYKALLSIINKRMAYELNREEPVAAGIDRIIREELAAAIRALENPGDNQEETIHSVRKRIKKIRAVFRLVRSDLDEEVFRQENIRYRNIGNRLSHLRDATVMIKTLDKLKETHPEGLPDQTFGEIRQVLVEKQAQVSKAFFAEENLIGEVIRDFREAEQNVPPLSGRDSFSVFAPNMKGIYRRGKKAYAVAVKEPSIHNLHELRKEVKNIGYHTRLLQAAWPVLFEAYEHELDLLSEMLGDDHDLGVLAEEIESGRLTPNNGEGNAQLVTAIHGQREELQRQLLPLAHRLFAEKAADFVGRYRLYWGIWRGAQPEGQDDAKEDS
jgi:CHAD domain-containing protein